MTVDARNLSCQALQNIDPDRITFHGDPVIGYHAEMARRGEDHVFGCELIGHRAEIEPMTAKQLTEIERNASYFAARTDADLHQLVGKDVPALLALVREQQARIDSADQAFIDWAQATGGLRRAADEITHICRIMSALRGHETPHRVAYNRVWAEVERFKADARQWHDTYQQFVNGTHEFFGELLALLPGAEDQGMDAYDQIPCGIKALTADRDRARDAAVALKQEIARLQTGITDAISDLQTGSPVEAENTLTRLIDEAGEHR